MAKWGEITWVFLHTLSVLSTEEKYTQHKALYFDTLLTICKCLPCPECQEHAILYMRSKKPPDTLQGFKTLIWEFHNAVNTSTHKRKYPIEILEIYKVVNLTKAFHFCRIAILTQPYNPKMISSRMYTEKSFKSMFERLTTSGILT